MSNPFITLIFSWALFGVFHSFMASDIAKKRIGAIMGNAFRYYRFIYSLLAAATLIAVLHAHFSCDKIVLWLAPGIEKIISALLIFVGLAIMIICAKKYLPRISGIDVMFDKNKQPVLQQSGLQAYVRHPLYLGTLLFIWGMFFGYPYLNNLISSICITLYTLIGIWFEEKKLIEIFGDAYLEYKRRVPALIPRHLSLAEMKKNGV